MRFALGQIQASHRGQYRGKPLSGALAEAVGIFGKEFIHFIMSPGYEEGVPVNGMVDVILTMLKGLPIHQRVVVFTIELV